MRLYAANATGTLLNAETVLLQVVMPLEASGRARILSWDVSFNGIISGNSVTFSLTRDSTSGTVVSQENAIVLDGTHQVTYDETNGPFVRSDFTVNPTASDTLDGPLQASDPSFTLRQYASGQEPVIDATGQVSLRCTPVGMTAAVGFKANLIFVA
jgi:hypothetical protein